MAREPFKTLQMVVRSDERMVVVGQTGSGKSTLAKALVFGPPAVSRLVVIDPKDEMFGLDSLREWWDREARRRLEQGQSARLRFVPPPGEEADWDELYSYLFYVRDLTVYIDEISMALPPRSMYVRTWLHGLYQQGRAFNISIIGLTQRPRGVPVAVLESCQWYVMFRTPHPEDRRLMAGFMGEEVLELPTDRYGFWIKHVTWPAPKYYPGIILPKGAKRGRSPSPQEEEVRQKLMSRAAQQDLVRRRSGAS